MRIKPLIAASIALFTAAAFAQASLGTVGSVQGIVTFTTVTNGVSSGGTVTPGTAITNGMRFVTPSGGGMTLQMNSGCGVTLKPDQAVTVSQSMTCEQLAKAVEDIAVPTASTGGSTGGGSALTGAFAVTGMALGAGIVNKTVLNNQSLSKL